MAETKMTGVEKAKKLIVRNSYSPGIISINASESLGYVIAEDIKSKVDLPMFDNSAMDGFAVKYPKLSLSRISGSLKLHIVTTIKAGDTRKLALKNGQAAKIMTGALIPKGTDTVVIKEDCIESDNHLILDKIISNKQNIRFKGEEIKKGTVGMKKGSEINPASIGFILEMGYKKIRVYRKPRISLLVTGEELSGINEKITAGMIRDTNSYSLSAAIKRDNMNILALDRIGDSYRDIKRKLSSYLKMSDIVIITGGISVGEYDYVKDILKELCVNKIFWRISQRPGGPMYFGYIGNKLVFGLPGNPVSSLVCYYEFVRPALMKMCGKKNVHLKEIEAILTENINKKPGKTHFVRGILERSRKGYRVKTSGKQGSHLLSTLASSNCFIILPKNGTSFFSGDRVIVHLLPD